MKLLLLTLLTSAVSITATPTAQTDYFFSYIGNDVIPSIRLRANTSSLDYLSPGITAPPFNPADHFMRISVNSTRCSPRTILNVVPTNPHPPPVPGYYGLTDTEEGTPEGAWRLVYTYRAHEYGDGFKYTEWVLKKGEEGKILLRYNGLPESDYRWVAVRTVTPAGVDKWVPYYVKTSTPLTGRGFEVVDLELVRAKGPVNSGAPGGVEE